MLRSKDRAAEMLSHVEPVAEIVRDEEVRQRLGAAGGHGLEAIRRASLLAAGAASDRRLQRELGRAVKDLRKARKRIARRGSHGARNALLLVLAAAAGMVAWTRGREKLAGLAGRLAPAVGAAGAEARAATAPGDQPGPEPFASTAHVETQGRVAAAPHEEARGGGAR